VSRRVQRMVLALGIVSVAGGAGAGAQEWVAPKCEIKAGHYLVNSSVLYLKSATETKFADQKAKDLRDVQRVLGQALETGGQQKNPAAWYYLGRYYVETKDVAGADSAFTKAAMLAPACAQDINFWRRRMWVPILNAGVAAWQAGNTDSAMTSFRRANQIFAGEPLGFAYLATLFSNANERDSAAKYFKLAVLAAQDPKFAKDKKDAMFNVARTYHGAQRWPYAMQAYKDYLAAYPDDVQATAGLATVYSAMGKADEAKVLYAQMLQHADAADAGDLFRAGQQMLSSLTSAEGVTPAQYRTVEQAFEAGLAKNPYHREALLTLAGVAVLAGDTTRALAAAQRLYAVDPLNRSALRMVAQTWQLKGKSDSTLHYLQLAESLAVEVTVGTFLPDEHGATLKGLLTNARSKATPVFAITFEFLSAKGGVVATEAVNVTAIPPGGNQPFELKASGAGIVAWRYRRT